MRFNLTPVVKNLLIINLVIFALSYLIRSSLGIDINEVLGLYSILSPDFKPYQLLTYMFLHQYVSPFGSISFAHIFGNMFGLFMFGPLLEQIWGAKRFLSFYILTGAGAGLLYLAVNFYENYQLKKAVEAYEQSPSPGKFRAFGRQIGGYSSQVHNLADDFEAVPASKQYQQESTQIVKQIYQLILSVPMVGASGAIFGILMAFGLLFPNTELFLLFFPFPIKAKYFVALYGLFELFGGIQKAPGDSVAHFAHLGGMLFAFILIRYWGTHRDKFY